MNSFVAKIKDGAIAAQKKYGVLASLTMAQAILESGWGKYAIGNNLFGIKAGGSWKGSTKTVTTTEYLKGKYVKIQAAFRDYASMAESIEDHAKLIAENSRYHNIIGCVDYKKVCRYIQSDGYATDPNYADKLISVIESSNLNQFDTSKVNPDYCDTSSLSLCPGMEYTFKTGSEIDFRCANNFLTQTKHCIGTDGYHYTTFKARALATGAGLYVNGKRICVVAVFVPHCDTSTVTKSAGQIYQFKSDFPLTCGNGTIWQQVGTALHQGKYYFTKFKASQKGCAGFYCGSTRVSVGTVI